MQEEPFGPLQFRAEYFLPMSITEYLTTTELPERPTSLPPGKVCKRSGSTAQRSRRRSRLSASGCAFGKRLTLAGSWQVYLGWSSPVPARSTVAVPPSSSQSRGPSRTQARMPSPCGNTGEAWRRPEDALLASTRCAKTDLLVFFITQRRLECKKKIEHRPTAYSLHDLGAQDKRIVIRTSRPGPGSDPGPRLARLRKGLTLAPSRGASSILVALEQCHGYHTRCFRSS